MHKSIHTAEYRLVRNTLRGVREAAGFSQRALASELNVSPSWVAKVEGGERRIDFLECCWFIAACKADPAKVLGELASKLGRRGASTRGSRK